jgi:hypothetical protein
MTMPSIETRIQTENAARYLGQLCRHATAMTGPGGRRLSRHRAVTDEVAVSIESSDTEATIGFGTWGRCCVRAEPGMLTARIEAIDAEKLARIQGIIGRNLERYARREGITMRWRSTDSMVAPDAPAEPTSPPGKFGAQRSWLTLAAVAMAVVLAAALHLGFGGAVLATVTWPRSALALIVVAVVVKTALVLGGTALHRKRKHRR